MKHTIKLTTCEIVVDESTELSTIERNVPLFFKTPHGKRETYDVYRGFLIVRNTVQFTGGKPERRTVVYAYTDDLEGSPNTFCVSTGGNLTGKPHAKRLIDKILAEGQYTFGMTA
jgi:hypothetical protein